jgi:hypothetical protein
VFQINGPTDTNRDHFCRRGTYGAGVPHQQRGMRNRIDGDGAQAQKYPGWPCRSFDRVAARENAQPAERAVPPPTCPDALKRERR